MSIHISATGQEDPIFAQFIDSILRNVKDSGKLPFSQQCQAFCCGFICGLRSSNRAIPSTISEAELGSREQIEAIANIIEEVKKKNWVYAPCYVREDYIDAHIICEGHYLKYLRKDPAKLPATSVSKIQRAAIDGYCFAVVVNDPKFILPAWCKSSQDPPQDALKREMNRVLNIVDPKEPPQAKQSSRQKSRTPF